MAASAPEITGYRVDHLLGEGGMGRVYAAEDLALGRRVAIKLIGGSTADTADSTARFEREARTLASIEHPNIVRVYSFGRVGTASYLVMEYIEGDTLADRIDRSGAIGVEEALRITRVVATALEAAWERQIVHRDIKPSNILFDRRGGVHVADFGLAKPLADQSAIVTRTELMVGTPHYVAPEQASGREIDFRSDIYSLGVVLFEMLTGRRPFNESTPVAVIARHLRDPLPMLPDDVEQSCRGVASLVRWMTAKSPESRPRSYRELLDRIDDLVRGVSIVSVPRLRRGRLLGVAAIGSALVILAALTFRGSWNTPAPDPAASRDPARNASATRNIGGRVMPSVPYRGKLLSLDMQEADLRAIFATFAKLAGLNIVLDNDVRGTASITLKEVPWDQAIDLVCNQNGLIWVLEGKVLRIARLDSLVAEKEKQRRLQELSQEKPRPPQ